MDQADDGSELQASSLLFSGVSFELNGFLRVFSNLLSASDGFVDVSFRLRFRCSHDLVFPLSRDSGVS
jgi:hypothetical protein